MNEWFAKYAKSLGLAFGLVAVAVQSALGGGIDTDEKIQIALVVVGAITTYIVPNLTAGIAHYAKAILAGSYAVLIGLAGWMIGGMDTSDWYNLGLAFLAAAGVLVLPSQKHPAGDHG